MPSFPSAHVAYCFAYEVLEGWHLGQSNWPTKERFVYGPVQAMHGGVNSIVTLAQSVMLIANRHDIVNGSGSWFVAAFIGQPEPQEFYGARKRRLDKAVCGFCEEMMRRGLLHNPDCIILGRCNKMS